MPVEGFFINDIWFKQLYLNHENYSIVTSQTHFTKSREAEL